MMNQQQMQGQLARIQQNTISGNAQNPLSVGFGMNTQAFNQGFNNQGFNQGFSQGVSQQQLDRIHQNSLYNGQSQPDGAYAERIHQATMQNGTMAQPQLNRQGGFGGQSTGFGMGMGMSNQGYGSMSQGLQQGVSQQQLERIHQASLYNGASQPDFAGVERIHAASMQNGTMANPSVNNYGGGAGSFNQGSSNQGFNQAYSNQAYNQGYNQGFSQSVSQQQLDRIHQNSLYNGQSQPDGAYAERIHQATMQNGTMAQPQLNSYNQGGFGGQSTGFGMGMSTQGFGSMNQGLQQGVSQQQIDRIHQNSLYNGQSQPDSAYAERIHQASMMSGTMAQPQYNQSRQGYGGGQSMSGFGMGGAMMSSGVFGQVMSADAGMRDAEGRTDVYPQSMYTGRNPYDTVNQSVMNQMTSQMNGMGRQF
ncbi:hypothetical protein [Tumebacillus flagellatus]|uniref:Uncharacterized protein n=1 Tax=Tumebacillus flagellatus TaxID=1157490 RepID=A0A074LMI2_9BACL|nr:hypothetical protein [Tumebacillus flagellatus]KEO81073.1 hypothetical protein EL26_22815 [Tumebacillus flagellatus]